MKKAAAQLHPRLRVLRGSEIVLGPGKADLLAAIGRTGKLNRAAKELGMSYMRAWKLVQTMNGAFAKPLVATTRGGTRHGTAQLTASGKLVLAVYREMERRSLKVSTTPFVRLRGLLRPS